MKYALYLMLLISTFSATAQVEITNISFEHNSADLSSDDLSKISEIAGRLNASHDNVISVTMAGFTDTTGTVEYNEQLSWQRTKNVEKALHDLWPGEVTLEWYGERNEGNAHAQTRSVDIIVSIETLPQVEIPKSNAENFIEVFSSVQQKAQQFYIPSNDSSIIIGDQGTVIDIPANSFDIPTAYAGANVTITLKEYYLLSDMLLAGFTTQCGDDLLQSGGMIDVNAYVAGKKVGLRDGKKLHIKFNTKRKLGEMELFAGERNEKGLVVWKRTKTPMTATNTYEFISLLAPAYFKEVSDLKSCPYFFCGLRQQFGMNTTNSQNRRTYGKIDWPAYRAYISEMKKSFGVKYMTELRRAIDEHNKKVGEINQYVVETSSLGLMNCDRFMNYPVEQRTKVIAESRQIDGASGFLAFTAYPAMLSVNYFEDGNIGFSNIGPDMNATLVLIRKDGEKWMLSIQNIVTARDTRVTPAFVEVTPEELKTKLKMLDENG
ncbi:MAG TPA: OmpA family protein [Chitinophagales bacterium]|nr:OmpA family protein [Chitinophagales bacterium]HMU69399.1 OmpA family protein [Chitinophagales bacterium]HMX03915.1 OmpA family protein [Chitinophagales bacterium]HMZ87894.1 OmpA family protein [Chitinophagales bacterium]HNA57514.1 OmpA family protein [Chitinophagales bacterium]